jgi:hypothetical protein
MSANDVSDARHLAIRIMLMSIISGGITVIGVICGVIQRDNLGHIYYGLLWGAIIGIVTGLFFNCLVVRVCEENDRVGVEFTFTSPTAFWVPKLFPFHTTTNVLLLVSAVILLYVNLRTSDQGLNEYGDGLALTDLDAITAALFFKGWPFSPYMVCSFHGMRWHPEESFVHLPLLLDALVAYYILLYIAIVSELLWRYWKKL